MGFGVKWRAWVRGTISTAKCSVLVNGSPMKELRMEKGLRQGDPLSPFLFILAVEGLNVAFKEAQRKYLFKGVRLDNSVEEFSLLQFADDAIIMGEWDPNNARNLVRILKCFELCSGLKINLSKSRLVGVSVSKEESDRMARWLKCKEESLPFNYLGLQVAWHKVLRDKENGGLGVGSLKALNIAMLGKWWWRERTEPNAKWKEVVTRCSQFNNRGNKGVWKGIQSIDNCLGELGINLNNLLQRKDNDWSWSLEPNNDFTVSSLRRLIDGISLLPAETKTFWVQWVPSKPMWQPCGSLCGIVTGYLLSSSIHTHVINPVNIHLWRTLRDSLATLDNLSKRGVSVPSDECKLCNAKPETLNHLFGECSTTSIVSAHLSRWLEWWPVNEITASGIWTQIDASTGNNIHRTVRRVITAAFFFLVLWTQRNSKIFRGSSKNEREMCEEIRFKAFDWIRCRSNFGKFLTWKNWYCNPIKVASLYIALAPH
ncbi:hypothetical protein OSB04_024831 [Centaurea solstitialis]|uniref:Reverse transcriptase domain-containing protein n=1 Tax=Centaurea solstitialis TaxID=347529 RepID=A0AA38SNI7_9ASTR|nr:hypothetical protein OSB04_024831 [Centaurea solstitialis]